MVLRIRPATLADERDVYRICLLTANAGKSAEELVKNPDICGTVYAVPYLHLSTTWKYVLVDVNESSDSNDEVNEEVVGYVVGASDCRAFEADANENWWPKAQQRFPKPPDSEKDQYTGYEWYYFETIAHFPSTGQEVIDVYPAFIHINILPPHQGKGWGTKLIRKAAEHVLNDGVAGLWVGIDSKNDSARKFYLAIGFQAIESKEGEYFALDIKKYLASGRGAK